MKKDKKSENIDLNVENAASIDSVLNDNQASEDAAATTAVVVDPNEEIANLHNEIAEANDKLLRLRAEYENYRRRSFKDIAVARSIAVSDTVLPFLNLFDNVSMALSSAANSDNIDAIRQGLQMIMGEYQRAIGDIGITKVEAGGVKFDPALHDAVAHELSDEVAEGLVIRQWTCGYKLGEKLLRPARVVVSAGPEKK